MQNYAQCIKPQGQVMQAKRHLILLRHFYINSNPLSSMESYVTV